MRWYAVHMKKSLYIGGIVLAVPILAFAYYAISPLFNTIKANDAAPVAQTGVAKNSNAFTVTPTAGHPASGSVRIVEADGKRFVRYENYKTINGPDLYVYLAKDLSAHEFVSLGTIKATEGSVNYELPAGVDIKQYPYVLTWCKQFGVLFNSAHIE